MHDIPSLHAAYNVLNLLASSWQMRLQLGLWVEFVENANGWRLFMCLRWAHRASMGRRWTCGKAGRSVKGGRVGAVRNGGGIADGCTKGACTPDMPLVASVGGRRNV